ncbi:MAG: GNAT family N-acetyltransferase [Candidatus Pacearchaeota archaeon]
MEYLIFTPELMSLHIDKLVSFEEDYTAFPEERWAHENFLRDLPKKWEWSQLAISGREIAGYALCSRKEDADQRPYIFVHRTFVVPSERNSFILFRCMRRASAIAKSEGVNLLQWYCSPSNSRVFEFHQGFADGAIASKKDQNREYVLFYKNL